MFFIQWIQVAFFFTDSNATERHTELHGIAVSFLFSKTIASSSFSLKKKNLNLAYLPLCCHIKRHCPPQINNTLKFLQQVLHYI